MVNWPNEDNTNTSTGKEAKNNATAVKILLIFSLKINANINKNIFLKNINTITNGTMVITKLLLNGLVVNKNTKNKVVNKIILTAKLILLYSLAI